jgi:hypothetical protein
MSVVDMSEKVLFAIKKGNFVHEIGVLCKLVINRNDRANNLSYKQ